MYLTQKQIQTIKDFFQDKPVKKVYVFGSYARGEADENSDVDILVEIDHEKKVGWQFFGWAGELEKIFGQKVDVLSKVLKPEHTNDWEFLKKVEAQSMLVYEKRRK